MIHTLPSLPHTGTRAEALAVLRTQHGPAGQVAAAWVDRLAAFVEGGGAGTTVGAAAASALLWVCRHAVRAGPDSPQWSAAQVCGNWCEDGVRISLGVHQVCGNLMWVGAAAAQQKL